MHCFVGLNMNPLLFVLTIGFLFFASLPPRPSPTYFLHFLLFHLPRLVSSSSPPPPPPSSHDPLFPLHTFYSPFSPPAQGNSPPRVDYGKRLIKFPSAGPVSLLVHGSERDPVLIFSSSDAIPSAPRPENSDAPPLSYSFSPPLHTSPPLSLTTLSPFHRSYPHSALPPLWWPLLSPIPATPLFVLPHSSFIFPPIKVISTLPLS